MSSRPPARGRDAGVVTGGGATSRLQRVLAIGTANCTHEVTTCMKNEDLVNNKLERLEEVFSEMDRCDGLDESATKEDERDESVDSHRGRNEPVPDHREGRLCSILCK